MVTAVLRGQTGDGGLVPVTPDGAVREAVTGQVTRFDDPKRFGFAHFDALS